MENRKKCAPITRGAAMSFGFKKATPSPVHSTTTANLPSVAANVTRETIEPLVIAPLEPRNGTPKLPRAKKDGLTKTPNRFGFRPIVPLSNKVADLNGKETDIRETPRPHSSQALKLSRPRSSSETRYQHPPVQEARPESVQGKYTNLPRPQLPVRSAPSNDKWAKTMANRQTATKPRQQNSSMSSLFSNSDSGISSQKTNKEPEPFEIQQLDHSPAMANKFRNSKEVNKGPLVRPTEMVLTDRRTKRFDLRDLVGEGAGSAGSQPARRTQGQGTTASVHASAQERREAFSSPATSSHRLTFSSDSDVADEGYDEASTEEKQFRDKEATEKDEMVCGGAGESPIDEMWGRGEAMALEDEVAATISQVDQSPSLMHQPLRSVLLKIEDPTFASLAAMSHSTLLEDEVGPETPNLSSSPPSSMEPLPPPPNLGKEGCPDSPDTPTHASNSLSSDTRERDFLIDDEIADQPGLVFDEARGNGTGTNDMSVTDTSKTIAKIAGEVSRVLASISPRMAKKHGDLGSTNSMSTLSPCESLASDDLMIDNDRSDASMFEDMNDLDDAALISEVETQRGQVMKEWNSILSSHPGRATLPVAAPLHNRG